MERHSPFCCYLYRWSYFATCLKENTEIYDCHSLLMRSVLFCLLISACQLAGCMVPQTLVHYEPPRLNGVSFVAPPEPIDGKEFLGIKKMNANCIALIPYAFGRQGSAALHYNTDHQMWGEKKEGIARCIQLAHEHGLKVMLKPQVWLFNNTYTGQFNLANAMDWHQWEKQYLDYILQFARLADAAKAELFCLGTEMETAVKKRPAFWSSLIDSVRKVYHGKITYADNWDTYMAFPFWKKLDFIGVNAYFPLSKLQTPPLEVLLRAWKPYLATMQQFSSEQAKPILFTEFGYRSIDYCAQAPWDASSTQSVNLRGQQQAYEALFRTFYPQPWFAGGFLWKWYDQQVLERHIGSDDYTPQQKPVLDLIRDWYRKNSEQRLP